MIHHHGAPIVDGALARRRISYLIGGEGATKMLVPQTSGDKGIKILDEVFEWTLKYSCLGKDTREKEEGTGDELRLRMRTFIKKRPAQNLNHNCLPSENANKGFIAVLFDQALVRIDKRLWKEIAKVILGGAEILTWP